MPKLSRSEKRWLGRRRRERYRAKAFEAFTGKRTRGFKDNGPVTGWRKPKKHKNQPYSKQPGPIASPFLRMEIGRGKAGTYPQTQTVKNAILPAREREKDSE